MEYINVRACVYIYINVGIERNVKENLKNAKILESKELKIGKKIRMDELSYLCKFL